MPDNSCHGPLSAPASDRGSHGSAVCAVVDDDLTGLEVVLDGDRRSFEEDFRPSHLRDYEINMDCRALLTFVSHCSLVNQNPTGEYAHEQT